MKVCGVLLIFVISPSIFRIQTILCVELREVYYILSNIQLFGLFLSKIDGVQRLIAGYRAHILRELPQLDSLDGVDRRGRSVDLNALLAADGSIDIPPDFNPFIIYISPS